MRQFVHRTFHTKFGSGTGRRTCKLAGVTICELLSSCSVASVEAGGQTRVADELKTVFIRIWLVLEGVQEEKMRLRNRQVVVVSRPPRLSDSLGANSFVRSCIRCGKVWRTLEFLIGTQVLYT